MHWGDELTDNPAQILYKKNTWNSPEMSITFGYNFKNIAQNFTKFELDLPYPILNNLPSKCFAINGFVFKLLSSQGL